MNANKIDERLNTRSSLKNNAKKPKIIRYGKEVITELITKSSFEILKFFIKDALDEKRVRELINVSLKKNQALNPERNQLR